MNKSKKFLCILGSVALSGGVIYLSYRFGCQHGVDIVYDVLKKYEPELCEEVNCVFADLYLGNYKKD